MADCPSCSGVLKYHIADQKLVCEYCGSKYHPADIDSTQSAEEYRNEMNMMVFSCPNCGGEVFSTDRDITGVCSYCGSNVVFRSRLETKMRPAKIIPFAQTKEYCKDAYMKLVKGNPFAPNALRNPEYIEGFRGIYMPYWISDISQSGDVKVYRQKSDEIKEIDYEFCKVYRVEGQLEASYSIYHDASGTFADDISERIEPFDPKTGFCDFYPSYLSGFYAEPANIDPETYQQYMTELARSYSDKFLAEHEKLNEDDEVRQSDYSIYDLMPEIPASDIANDEIRIRNWYSHEKKQADRREKKEFKRRFEADRDAWNEDWKKYKAQAAEIKKANTAADKQSTKEKRQDGKQDYHEEMGKTMLAFFPVWFLSYRNRDRVAYITVNGQSGQVSADIPVSIAKFFRNAAFVLPLCLLFTYWMMFRPITVGVLSCWFSAMILWAFSDECGVILDHQDGQIHTLRSKGTQKSADTMLIVLLALCAVAGFIAVLCLFSSDMELLRGTVMMKIYALAGFGVALFALPECITTWKAIPGDERPLPVYLLSAFSAALELVVVWINPNNDYIYYGMISIGILVILLNMVMMILSFNKSATRPLPQFAHKGGDDHA